MTPFRPRRSFSAALLALCLAAVAAPRTLQADFPEPRGYVNDFAGVLDGPAAAELDALLRGVERDTSAEVAVATVQSLDGLSVEEYANRLFQRWGIGKKGKDNGVLVLVAPTERKMRIEVGYGLEPVLPDGLAGEIIRTDFLPRFRENDYRAGIEQGVRHVAAIIRANHTLTPDERRRFDAPAEGRPPAYLMVPFFGLFVGLGAFAIGLGFRSRTVFPLLWGSIFGGVPFAMALVPFFNTRIWILGLLAIATFVWGWRKGHDSKLAKSLRGTRRGAAHTGWVMGASSSGSRSGGGSGGGGGFGGGSSGGGGASGSW